MSRYTTQLRYPIMQFLDDMDLSHEESNWNKIYDKLGLNDYPIFDELYREELNNKIIRHYYMREIGAETFELFKLYLRRTLFEIMPYYNKLYLSEALVMTDPLNDIDMHYDRIWEDASNNTGSLNTIDSNRHVFQDTPMSLLDNTTSPTIQGMDYASNVSYDNGSASNATTSDTTRDGSNSEHEYGHRQNQSELLQKYRETFLNIDMLVIDELEVCFFKLWN